MIKIESVQCVSTAYILSVQVDKVRAFEFDEATGNRIRALREQLMNEDTARHFESLVTLCLYLQRAFSLYFLHYFAFHESTIRLTTFLPSLEYFLYSQKSGRGIVDFPD